MRWIYTAYCLANALKFKIADVTFIEGVQNIFYTQQFFVYCYLFIV